MILRPCSAIVNERGRGEFGQRTTLTAVTVIA